MTPRRAVHSGTRLAIPAGGANGLTCDVSDGLQGDLFGLRENLHRVPALDRHACYSPPPQYGFGVTALQPGRVRLNGAELPAPQPAESAAAPTTAHQ